VIEALGTSQFTRVKIGIGRPAPGLDAADYVLQPVTQDEMAAFTPCLERAVDALECLIHRGLSTAMNQFNIREKPTGRWRAIVCLCVFQQSRIVEREHLSPLHWDCLNDRAARHVEAGVSCSPSFPCLGWGDIGLPAWLESLGWSGLQFEAV